MEDFTYHRPVLAAEAVELLAPHAGAPSGFASAGIHRELKSELAWVTCAAEEALAASASPRSPLVPRIRHSAGSVCGFAPPPAEP